MTVDNIDTLTAAGILAPGAVLSPADVTAINSLTPQEVAAIISIFNKLGPTFMQHNLFPRFIF